MKTNPKLAINAKKWPRNITIRYKHKSGNQIKNKSDCSYRLKLKESLRKTFLGLTVATTKLKKATHTVAMD